MGASLCKPQHDGRHPSANAIMAAWAGRMVRRTWLVPASCLSTSTMHQMAQQSLVFSRLVNTAISRAASLPLIKRFIVQFQGHNHLADARAYRLMSFCAGHRSIRAHCALYSGACSWWVLRYFAGTALPAYQATSCPHIPGPLAQPCICRLLDPTANRFTATLRLR